MRILRHIPPVSQNVGLRRCAMGMTLIVARGGGSWRTSSRDSGFRLPIRVSATRDGTYGVACPFGIETQLHVYRPQVFSAVSIRTRGAD